ncbi:hypothetical protein AB0H00_23670 [Nocardia sp. NPDC023852]|uniref:hypothetical protein n=1 Tax=Nocardia sp. NPDC023852 TaxID=3154697 RepID=UPI0033F9C6A1
MPPAATIVLVHGAFADASSWQAALRTVVEIDAPHLVMQTHPDEVATVVSEAIDELA